MPVYPTGVWTSTVRLAPENRIVSVAVPLVPPPEQDPADVVVPRAPAVAGTASSGAPTTSATATPKAPRRTGRPRRPRCRPGVPGRSSAPLLIAPPPPRPVDFCVIDYISWSGRPEWSSPGRRTAVEPSSDPPVSRSRRPGVTISQVAAAAGVSTATVSRVMSGRGYVSDATRRRVLATVERVGYRPSASARSPNDPHGQPGRAHRQPGEPGVPPVHPGVEHVAEAHGYAVLIADSRRSPDVERHEASPTYAYRVEALIVGESVENPEHLETLARVGLRVFRAPDVGGDAPAWSATAIEAPAIVAACGRSRPGRPPAGRVRRRAGSTPARPTSDGVRTT